MKNKTLNAHAWLEANKEKWPNASTISEIMEDYAKYYYMQKKKDNCICNPPKLNVDGKNNN
jgi:hypothetical protein